MNLQSLLTSNKEFTNACLALFQALPERVGQAKQTKILPEQGLILVSSNIELLEEWVKENVLSGHQLNKTFHKSWGLIKDSSNETLLVQQILHYFSTYGLESLGLEEQIWIPAEELEIPERLKYRVIKDREIEEIINRCKEMLASGTALKESTVFNIVEVLKGLEVDLASLEVNNKEAQVLVVEATGDLPNKEDELFRYLFYKATGGLLMVIKNKASYSLIINNGYELPELTEEQILELAKGFNRRKQLWMSFKKANKGNISLVNRIAKKSKKVHRPMQPDVLNTLTSKKWPISLVEKEANKAAIPRLIKAVNALRFYQRDDRNRVYRVRNGKAFTKERISKQPSSLMALYETTLLQALKEKLGMRVVKAPNNISLKIPSSEKNFMGPIPFGSSLTIEMDRGKKLLVGIHWDFYNGDLDLRADSRNHSVAWNKSYKIDENGNTIYHSGDLVRGPATEWLCFTQINEVFRLDVNGYHNAEEGAAFKMIVGLVEKGPMPDDKDQNYIINPDDVILELDVELLSKGTTIGFIKPSTNDEGQSCMTLTLGSGGMNNQAVGGGKGDLAIIAEKAMVNSTVAMLGLPDIFTLTNSGSSGEGYVDLSEDLTADKVLSLISANG